jgi:adenylate cyclase
MAKETAKFIRIDLNQFKLHLYLKPGAELTLHFDSPSRRFYLSVIGLVVHEMKKQGRIISIPLEKHIDVLALLNETVGASAGSSKKELLLPRIYRKWKDALPDLENAPLFKVVGRKKRYDELMDRVYGFSEGEKDSWANLFEYKGSHEHIRLRFSIDRLGAGLDDVMIVYGESPELTNGEAWERFIARLKEKREGSSRPARTYQQLKAPESPRLRPGNRLGAMLNRWQWAALCVLIAFVVVGAAAFAVWKNNSSAPQAEVASVEKMAFRLPDKPSIAVLPFNNMSDDPKQDYFCDGLTEEIITALSKTPNIFVIARNSTFTYKGKAVKVHQIAEELGVQYVLEGSVRKAGDRARITAQLSDALSGHHLWAERYDRDLEDIFTVQDEITLSVLKELQIKLTEGENIRLRSDTKNLEAWICYVNARACYQTFRKEEYIKGIKLLERAVELDPEYASAWALRGLLRYAFYKRNWCDTGDLSAVSRRQGIELVDKALEMNENNILALNCRAGMHLHERQWDKALAMLEKSIAIAPNDSSALATLAKQKFCLGKFEEAIEHGEESIRLDPFHASWQLWYLARPYNWSGHYKEALEVYERILKLCEKENCSTGYVAPVYLEMAMSYMGLGMEEEARYQIAESLRLDPDVSSLEKQRNYFSKRFRDPSHAKKIIDALRRAGAPE